MLTGPWNLDNKNMYDQLPYAGTAQSIKKINAHEKWKLDHHRKLFAGNEHDIISPYSQHGDWNTIHQTRYQEPIDLGTTPAGAPTIPAGMNPLWGGARIDASAQMAKQQLEFYQTKQQEYQDAQR